jgi:hypothetical protein
MTKTPLFTAFLERAIPHAPERDFAQSELRRWAAGESKRPIVLYGAGATGKTTLQLVLEAAARPERGSVDEIFTANSGFQVDDEFVIRLYHVVPVDEMDIRLAKKIIRDELEGVRAWLGIEG